MCMRVVFRYTCTHTGTLAVISTLATGVTEREMDLGKLRKCLVRTHFTSAAGKMIRDKDMVCMRTR